MAELRVGSERLRAAGRHRLALAGRRRPFAAGFPAAERDGVCALARSKGRPLWVVQAQPMVHDREPPPPTEHPRLGTRVGSAYEVVEVLGRGAMGIVLRARDDQLGREVALKVLARHHWGDERQRQAFLQEARTLAGLRHQNVVEIYAYEEWRGRPVLVMEHLPGGSLDLLLDARRGAPLSMARVRELVADLCRGLAAIHRAGTVHRDLKPANVLLASDGHLKIGDFGLAVMHGLGDEEGAAGTPAYMSPEALSEDPATRGGRPGDDLWALGVIAYELLTGVRPFGVGAFDDVMAAQLSGPPAAPSAFRGALPVAIDELFSELFSPDPRRRPPSAERLAERFVAALDASDGGRPRRILVVDDDQDFLDWMCTVIEASVPRVRVEGFERAELLFAAATGERVDLIISDLDMPGTDGLELTRRLRGDPRTRRVPILVLTASGSAADWQLLRDDGADAFLVKPIDEASLAASLERHLRRSAAR